MVSIGSLSWTVQVKNAAQAKKDAQDVEDSVEGAKDAVEGADEGVGGLAERLGGLSGMQETVGKGFDKMNAKAGFLGTSLQFLKGTVGGIVGALTGLSGILLGGGLIVALVALATAFKHNIGNIQGKTDELLEDLGSLTSSGIEGFNAAMKGLGGALSIIIGVIGSVVGVVADLNEQFNFVAPAIQAIITLIGAFAIAWTIVQVVTAIISGFISLISVAGSVMSGIATLISVFSTVISVISTVISIVAGLIAALNPVTLIVLAIVAVIIALYAAWKTNFLGIRDITDDVISWVTTKFNEFVDVVKNVMSDAKKFLGNFVKGASNWGKNLINEIVGGVKSKANAVKDAVSDVVGKARKYLPFSPAEKGPLSDLHKTGPAFVKTVASGIKDESPELAKSAKMAASQANQGMMGGMQPERTVRRGTSGMGGNGQGMTKIEIQVGGIDIGDQTLDLRNMSRAELQRLAQEIAKALGNEVRTVIT